MGPALRIAIFFICTPPPMIGFPKTTLPRRGFPDRPALSQVGVTQSSSPAAAPRVARVGPLGGPLVVSAGACPDGVLLARASTAIAWASSESAGSGPWA